MTAPSSDDVFDCIIVGSGTAGATLARELSRDGRKVLLLERGKYQPLKETVWSLASMFNEVKVADKLKDARVFAAGGSSAMYLAMMDEPPIEEFRSLGIDLTDEYEAVKRELPVAVMPDALISPQALHLKEAAIAEGHEWKKTPMLIDQSLCDGSYSYRAKWKALDYVDQAVRQGAKLLCRTRVERVIIENNVAVGVECRIAGGFFTSRRATFRAKKIIVSSGSLETPVILQNSGLPDVVAKGYYIDPSLVIFGRVPGLKGRDSFAGVMGATLEDGTKLQDASVHKLPFVMFMIQMLKPLRVFSYPQHLGIMVKTHDEVGGSLSADGRYHKTLEPAVFDKLKAGEEAARNILLRAGATSIFKTPMMTGGAFGTLRIKEDVDERLQTKVKSLYVCDGSLIPEHGRVLPTLTLICLAKYLAKVLMNEPTSNPDGLHSPAPSTAFSANQ